MRGRKPTYPVELPEWFRLMNINGMLTTEEVAALFGFKIQSIYTETHEGIFPKLDKQIAYNRKYFAKSRWRKSTILAEIERRKKLATVAQ